MYIVYAFFEKSLTFYKACIDAVYEPKKFDFLTREVGSVRGLVGSVRGLVGSVRGLVGSVRGWGTHSFREISAKNGGKNRKKFLKRRF